MKINFGFRIQPKAEDILISAQGLLISAKNASHLQDFNQGFDYFCQAIELIKQSIDLAEKKSDSYLLTKSKSLLRTLLIGNKASFYNAPGNEHIALAQLDIKTIAKTITLQQKHFQRWLNEQSGLSPEYLAQKNYNR